MARVNLYVSDELRARMNEAGDALNWSDIARPAFEAALANHNHRKGQTMQTAIERLRASKVQHEQQQESEGKQVGRDWASSHAEFAELKAIAAIEIDSIDYRPEFLQSLIKQAIDPQDNMKSWDVSEKLFDSQDWPDDTFLEAWVEGAQEFFAEVEGEL